MAVAGLDDMRLLRLSRWLAVAGTEGVEPPPFRFWRPVLTCELDPYVQLCPETEEPPCRVSRGRFLSLVLMGFYPGSAPLSRVSSHAGSTENGLIRPLCCLHE